MLSRFSISARLIAMCYVVIVVLTAAMLSITVYNLRGQMSGLAQGAQETNMKVAWEVLREQSGAMHVVDGKLMAGGVALNDNNTIVDRIRDLVGGTATIFQGDRRVATNVMKSDGSRAVGTHLAHGPVYDTIFKEKKPYRGEADILGVPYFTAYDPILDDAGNVIGILYVGIQKHKFFSVIWDIVIHNLAMSLVVALLAGIFVHFVVQRLLKPLGRLRGAMEALSSGDTAVNVEGAERSDELGRMARAVGVFKENAVRVKRMATEKAEQERQAETERREAFAKLAADFEASVSGVVDQLSAATKAMRGSAESLSGDGEKTTAQAGAAAQGAERAAGRVQAMAAAAEELSASIANITRDVGESSQISGGAADQARQANAQVQGLAEAARNIGEVVQLITEIAEQTNLLALNATIEAARAGDAGKGFAVVANEVKSLATQTAKATDDITCQIRAIQSTTTDTVQAIQAVGQTIERVNEISREVATAMDQQAAATAEISRHVQDAVAGAQDTSSNVAGVRKVAEQTQATAGEVLDAAAALSRQAEVLRTEVARFLAEIRAA